MLLIFIIDNTCGNRAIIQEGEFFFLYRYPLRDPGVFVEVVVIAQAAFINDFVYQLTAFAAKDMLFKMNAFAFAGIAAMAALYICLNGRWHNCTPAKLL